MKSSISQVQQGHPVCVFGGANMDVLAHPHSVLVAQDSTPGTVECMPGGVARNVAENLARLGVPTHLFSAVGDDPFGEQLLRATRSAGVNTEALVTLPSYRTASYLALHGLDGDMSYAVNDMDILLGLTPELLEQHEALMSNASSWVVDCNLNSTTLNWLFEHPKRPAVLVDAVSVAKCPKLVPSLARIHTLKANRLEAMALSGLAINDIDGAKRAAQRLHELGAVHVVLSLGHEGVCWCDGGGATGHRPAKPVDVVSTTGAGDALLAGLVHGHLSHLPLPVAVEFAMACAELTLGSPFANAPGLSVEAVYSRLSL